MLTISFLLKNWCDISIVDNKVKYEYNKVTVFHNHFNYCETFRLAFDEKNELVDIQNIKF